MQKYATPEDAREARRVRNRIASKQRKAARAIAQGREPGRVGGVRKYVSDEERAAARKQAYDRWRERNLEYVRERDAETKRKERRARAAAEGRKLQKVGGDPHLSPEERRERARRNSLSYWQKHPAKRKEAGRKYYLDNKPLWREKVRNRRARRKNAQGSHTNEDIQLLWELQRGRCVFCLKRMRWGKFEIDHHIPLALGGSNDRGNLRLLHRKCNREKAARDPAYHAKQNGLLCW